VTGWAWIWTKQTPEVAAKESRKETRKVMREKEPKGREEEGNSDEDDDRERRIARKGERKRWREEKRREEGVPEVSLQNPMVRYLPATMFVSAQPEKQAGMTLDSRMRSWRGNPLHRA
jgi:hypothetical protein